MKKMTLFYVYDVTDLSPESTLQSVSELLTHRSLFTPFSKKTATSALRFALIWEESIAVLSSLLSVALVITPLITGVDR